MYTCMDEWMNWETNFDLQQVAYVWIDKWINTLTSAEVHISSLRQFCHPHGSSNAIKETQSISILSCRLDQRKILLDVEAGQRQRKSTLRGFKTSLKTYLFHRAYNYPVSLSASDYGDFTRIIALYKYITYLFTCLILLFYLFRYGFNFYRAMHVVQSAVLLS